MVNEDNIELKSTKKVHEIIKIFENNFVDKTPMVEKPKIDEIECSPENKCRLKNAFEVIMRQGVIHQSEKHHGGIQQGLTKRG